MESIKIKYVDTITDEKDLFHFNNDDSRTQQNQFYNFHFIILLYNLQKFEYQIKNLNLQNKHKRKVITLLFLSIITNNLANKLCNIYRYFTVMKF